MSVDSLPLVVVWSIAATFLAAGIDGLRRGWRLRGRPGDTSAQLHAESLREIARRHGLSWTDDAAAGVLAGENVRLLSTAQGRQLVIDRPPPAGVVIETDPSRAKLPRLAIGDPEFDETFRVDGPPVLLRATLDRVVRAQLREFSLHGAVEIEGGSMRFALPSAGTTTVDFRIRDAIDIARRLAETAPAPRLRAIADDEQEPIHVRAHALEALFGIPGDDADTRVLATRMLSVRHAALRLRAAIGLDRWDVVASTLTGPPSLPLATGIAEWLAEWRADLLPKAITALCAEEPHAELVRALASIAKSAGVSLRVFQPLLASASTDVRAAAGRALTSADETLTSLDATTLHALLGDEQDDDTVKAAVDELGARGGVGSIERLHAVARHRRLAAADDAIRRIQRRAGGAAGEVSLATTEERGALSEPERPPATRRRPDEI